MGGMAPTGNWGTMLAAGVLLCPQEAGAVAAGESKAGVIVWAFLGVCALIALRQLWPAIRRAGTFGKDREREGLKRGG